MKLRRQGTTFRTTLRPKKKEYRGIVVEEFTKDQDQNTTNQCSEYRGIIVEEVETQAHEEKTTHDANIQGQVILI